MGVSMRQETPAQGAGQGKPPGRSKIEGPREEERPAAVLGLTLEPIVREHLMEIELQHGLGFRCVVTCGEALRVMGTEPPGLVVIDIDVAEGRSLVRTVRTDAQWRDVQLFGLTATNNPMATVTL